MKLSLLYAYRLVKQGKKFYAIAILNIALGLMGLFILQNFKFSIEESVQDRVMALMGSHLSLSTRTEFDPQEIENIERALPEFEKQVTERFYTMMEGPKGLRLVQVNALDAGYPFFGGLELSDGLIYPFETNSLTQAQALLSPDLELQLGVKQGDEFKIGSETFIARDYVVNDLSQSFNAFSLAPKVYISREMVEQTDLIQKGSIKRTSLHYRFNEPLSNEQVELANKQVTSPGLRLSTPDKNGDQVSRFLNYLNDFLGLSSLMAFTLVSLGLHYYYKSQTDRWRAEVALLKYLGVTRQRIFFAFFFFMALVSVGGAILTFLLASAFTPILKHTLLHYLGSDFQLNFYGVTPFIILLIALLGNLLLSLPVILPVLQSQCSSVFSEQKENSTSRRLALVYVPFFLFLWAMAIWLANSWRTGSIFIGALVVITLGTSVIALLLLKIAKAVSNRQGGAFKLSIRYLSHFRVSTLTMVTSLALSIGLMVFIPGLKSAIEKELEGANAENRPSFFLFDIQDEQLKDFHSFTEEEGFAMNSISPMIRSRIESVNGETFKRSTDSGFGREEEVRQRFRNRGVNLSFAQALPQGDVVLEGEWFRDSFDWEEENVAEISVERRYAKRLGIKMNDQLVFDILGMPVEAKVTSIRKVQWTTFNPNFFLILQPGVLEQAPKTWLASSSHLSKQQRKVFQLKMYERFPNVSLVDVENIAKRIFTVVEQMSIALQGMSVMSLFVAFIVLGSLIYQKIILRRNDLGLLKILGMTQKRITRLILMECFIISVIASFIGLVAGAGLVALFSNIMFGMYFIPLGIEYTLIPLLSILVSLGIAYSVIQKLQKNPNFYRQVF